MTGIDQFSKDDVNLEIARLQKLNELTSTIQAMEVDEVAPATRAFYIAESLWFCLEDGTIDVSDAYNFAQSMIDECSVPVVIGTEEIKIYPTAEIIKSRPVLVQQLKDKAVEADIDFDRLTLLNRDAALKIIDMIEADSANVAAKYGPLGEYLTDEQAVEEIINRANIREAARQFLLGGAEPVDENSLKSFFEISLPNVIYGTILRDRISKKYLVHTGPGDN